MGAEFERLEIGVGVQTVMQEIKKSSSGAMRQCPASLRLMLLPGRRLSGSTNCVTTWSANPRFGPSCPELQPSYFDTHPLFAKMLVRQIESIREDGSDGQEIG